METHNVQAAWREYARTRAPRLRESLIRSYAPLARRAVDRLQITPWGCVSKDDLLGHALIGLIDAIERFNPEHGVPFEGFAAPRIRGAVLDSLRRLDWAPRSLRSDEARMRRACETLEGVLGRAPTDAEIARELGVSQEELETLETRLAQSSVLSLDDLVVGRSDGAQLGDLTPGDASLDPSSRYEAEAARRELKDAIDRLPEREKQVVSLYYFHELTLKEIGKVLRVTEQRVSQIHARAMVRLNHRLTRHHDLVASLVA